MTIQLNGNDREFPEGTSLSSLLTALRLPPGPVAAQVNEEIVHRDRYDACVLHDGDVVEIFTMLGGG
jgi:thiamine biosynthesis protein ThiS